MEKKVMKRVSDSFCLCAFAEKYVGRPGVRRCDPKTLAVADQKILCRHIGQPGSFLGAGFFFLSFFSLVFLTMMNQSLTAQKVLSMNGSLNCKKKEKIEKEENFRPMVYITKCRYFFFYFYCLFSERGFFSSLMLHF